MYNILVVECYDYLADTFRNALSNNEDYNVVIVESGYTALEAVDLKRFHLIIIENDLPYLSGVKTARNLRRKLSYDVSPFVVVTPSLNRETVEDYFSSGIADFLTVPLRIATIQNVVKKVLTTWKSAADNIKSFDKMQKKLLR